MNRVIFTVFSLLSTQVSILYGNVWSDRWMAEMNTISNQPIKQQIERLGAAVRAKSTAGGQHPTDDQLAVANRAIALLKGIPGHAEYYRDKILGTQERLNQVFRDTNLRGPAFVNYTREQMYGFETLAQLPSPETVRVLGELISNDWLPPGNETADPSVKLPPLSERTMVLLVKFPLVNKPFNSHLTRGNIGDARAAWQLWYEQVKSGNRTFQFEGTPTEYDLNGPAPKQKLERIARDLKRDAERAPGRGRATEPTSTATTVDQAETPVKAHPIAAIIAGVVFLGSLVWYFARKRRRWDS